MSLQSESYQSVTYELITYEKQVGDGYCVA